MNTHEAEGSERTPEWHTYRCPVCGHTDEVDLVTGPVRAVTCSHCGTSLEVTARATDAAAAVVRVVNERLEP